MNVLCIGTAVVDIMAAPVGDSKNWKEKQRIERIEINTGGDGANQSCRMADSGLGVYFMGAVGNDANGEMLCASLASRSVRTDLVQKQDTIPTGTSLVLVDEAGNRHAFSVKGAHSTLSRDALPDIDFLKSHEIKAISIASLFSLPVLEKDGLLEFLKDVKLYSQDAGAADTCSHLNDSSGILVFADLGSDKLKQGLAGIKDFLPYIDYFLPSEYDALDMTGKKSAEDAATVYAGCGCQNVIIKCGEKGCYYLRRQQDGDRCGFIPALPVTPIDTTGAGDCMAALFISRILKGEDISAACRYACTGASLSTLYPGASNQQISDEMIQKALLCNICTK